MNFPSTILSVFGFHGGTQSPDDSSVEVPSIVQPTIELPAAILSTTEGVGVSTPKLGSFGHSILVEITNAAAQDDYIFVLGPGLWDVYMQASWVSSHTTFAKRGFIYLGIEGNPASASNIAVFSSVANVPQETAQRFRVAVGNAGGLSFSYIVPVQGVGESTRLAANFLCNRMG